MTLWYIECDPFSKIEETGSFGESIKGAHHQAVIGHAGNWFGVTVRYCKRVLVLADGITYWYEGT